MYAKLIEQAALKINASTDFISRKPATGRIVFADGQSSVFCESDLGLNSGAEAELVQNKHICGKMLRHLGFNSPPTHLIRLFADVAENESKVIELDWDEINDFTDRTGAPLFLKPNMGTEGADIYKIEDKSQIEHAIHQMHGIPSVILQKACRGQEEYRVVVLDGKIELAYGRQPFEITGDGLHTIDTLIRYTVEDYQKAGRAITLRIEDPKIDFKLAVDGLSRFVVLESGITIRPLANVNLSEGATSVECTDLIQTHFGNLCQSLRDQLGMRYFGLDLMVDWKSKMPDYDIIEINRKPGFPNFAGQSDKNFEQVQRLFDKIVATIADRKGVRQFQAAPAFMFNAP